MKPIELSAERRRNLDAAVARILPSDDGPGARETGVGNYIVGALADRINVHFVSLFERGLDFLAVLAQEKSGQGFDVCPPSLQDEILREVEVYPNNEARRFFAQLVLFSLEGFLGDPKHGGNRAAAGWHYLGLQLEGREIGDCKEVSSWRT